MSIKIDNAQVYDVEVFPNCFTLTASPLYSDGFHVWEISEFRNDRSMLVQWFNWLHQTQTPMIGFNNEGYDYLIIHLIYLRPDITPQEIYQKSKSIVSSTDRFGQTIWPRDRFAPQIDLYKIHHFDNKAKIQSLKGLQFNMRSDLVLESELSFDEPVTELQINTEVIPYNKNDVAETKRFAHYSLGAIDFRLGLIDQFGVEVLNWNDTKIGEKMLEKRLGDDVCYDRSTGKKQKRQTIRAAIKLDEIIFPYVSFTNPEFQRVLEFMRAQVLTGEDIETENSTAIKTKGVFTELHADVGGIRFHFGTGGVHASVDSQRFIATPEWPIRDIDVEGLYPNIAIKNRLAPEHLGEAFIAEYAKIPAERKQHKKGTYMNAALKLAANGAWGKSNSVFSVFYDPKYAMTVPINGQLMICMLVEHLVQVPTLKLIQANTDGVTYQVHHSYLDQCKEIERWWQDYTLLTLESVDYSRMWIRDVNNYVAEDTDGKLKLKGAYWSPDSVNYAESISNASPPSWHKNLSTTIVPKAAVAAMVYGVDPQYFIRAHTDPFDFMLRAKVDRSSILMHGEKKTQRVTRYYISNDGKPLLKISPPVAGGVEGSFKRANGVTTAEYNRVMAETNGEWDERVCTKNKSRYEKRRTFFQAGFTTSLCNKASDFTFDNLNYDWYINEARKLIVV